MFKDHRYINAGTNEFYRWGHKAIDMVKAGLVPNEKGYCSIVADGDKYWTFGTSTGKYGEYAKYNDTFFSVNRGGYIWVKVDSDKYEKYVEMLNNMIEAMKARHMESFAIEEEE